MTVNANFIPHITSGRLKPLAISGKMRAPPLPQAPTFAEAGLPAFDMTGWTGLFAPAGTPKEIVDKISSEMARILAMPEIVDRRVTPLLPTPRIAMV